MAATQEDVLKVVRPLPRAHLRHRLKGMVRLLPADLTDDDLDALRVLLAWPAFWREIRERHAAFKEEWKDVQEKWKNRYAKT